MDQERIEEILEEHLYVTDEWGGSKLASWRYGHDVVVGGIDEAAAEIVLGGWTRVTDDPKTRSMRGIAVLGAWVNGTNARIVCASCWDGGKWRSDGPPSELIGWRLYAWMEWPLAPPLPSVGQ